MRAWQLTILLVLASGCVSINPTTEVQPGALTVAPSMDVAEGALNLSPTTEVNVEPGAVSPVLHVDPGAVAVSPSLDIAEGAIRPELNVENGAFAPVVDIAEGAVKLETTVNVPGVPEAAKVFADMLKEVFAPVVQDFAKNTDSRLTNIEGAINFLVLAVVGAAVAIVLIIGIFGWRGLRAYEKDKKSEMRLQKLEAEVLAGRPLSNGDVDNGVHHVDDGHAHADLDQA